MKKVTFEELSKDIRHDYPSTYTDEKYARYELILIYDISTRESDWACIENRYYARNLKDLRAIIAEQILLRTYNNPGGRWITSEELLDINQEFLSSPQNYHHIFEIADSPSMPIVGTYLGMVSVGYINGSFSYYTFVLRQLK